MGKLADENGKRLPCGIVAQGLQNGIRVLLARMRAIDLVPGADLRLDLAGPDDHLGHLVGGKIHVRHVADLAA